MASFFDLYRSSEAPLSPHNMCWNMYGSGLENVGRDGKPEICPIPKPDEDQLLVRVDAVSLCLSDTKLIMQGSKHPRLHDRDLLTDPTRLGHEVSLTVMQVGEHLQRKFKPGQRLAIQPDIYKDGISTAYGYMIPGGLIRYHLIGKEIINADIGSYLIPLKGELGYAEVALTEPWACVTAAYTQRRRLAPKSGGTMWILGYPGDSTEYKFSTGLNAPAKIIVTDIPDQLLELIESNLAARGGTLMIRNGLTQADYLAMYQEFIDGFDDIILLNPHSAQTVTTLASMVAHRGTINLVGRIPLDDYPQIDIGRIHYDYIAYLGTTGPDIADAYGETRNRCDLRPGGIAIFVGAGGPMGQMHIQRAIEMQNGPSTILATDVNPVRLEVLNQRFTQLASQRNNRLVISDSNKEPLIEFVQRETDHQAADDGVVCVPSAEIMAETAQVLKRDGMLVLFAGVPVGTYARLNLSKTYLHAAQFTGTSGSALADQVLIINAAQDGFLAPAKSVAAIGGMEAAYEGICALMEGRFPGKIVIYPQLSGLPLVGLPELKNKTPLVANYLDEDGGWTREAESALIELFWKP
jgi:threonine dehydrogenase-like Zn-dependent dehydrogenase